MNKTLTKIVSIILMSVLNFESVATFLLELSSPQIVYASTCSKDLNGNGSTNDPGETAECIVGSNNELCPIGAVNCTVTHMDPICPFDTTLNKATDKCEATTTGITCPSGYTYDNSLGQCTQQPTCDSSGVLNVAMDRCETTLTGSCPNGYYYDTSTQACMRDIACPSGGSYDSSIDACTVSAFYSCPYGMTYNSTTGKCESSPVCSSGFTYNTSSDRCEKQATPQCPSGYTYNASTSRCEAIYTCPAGSSFNSVTDRCETDATITCPSGYTYNSTTSKCETSPSCVAGTLYDTTLDKCVVSPTQQCPSGFTYDSVNGVCYQSATCNAGGILNTATDVCETSYSCPSGTTFNTNTNKCELAATWQCPTGSTYNSATGKCEVAPSYSCPTGYAYNSSTGKCEIPPVCPSTGQQLSYNTLRYSYNSSASSVTVTSDGLQFNTTRSGDGTVNGYNYHGVWQGSYVIQSGDKLVYDVYIPTGLPGCRTGNFEFDFSDGTAARQFGIYDQNGIHGAQGCISSTYAGTWYHREFNLTNVVGKTISYFDLVNESDNPGTYNGVLYKNIMIVNGSTVKLVIWGSYNPFTNRCEASGTCPSGLTYDSSLNKCVAQATTTCPLGYTYNSSTDKCEILPLCPPPAGQPLGYSAPRYQNLISYASAETTSDSIKFDTTVTGNGTGNAYSYYAVWFGFYTIQSGDKLIYDVYVPSGLPGCRTGNFEFDFTDGTAARQFGIYDQNGIHSAQGCISSTYAGTWYHREFNLTNVVGKTISYFDLVNESDNPGTYNGVLYKNIMIVNGSTTKLIIFEGYNSFTNRCESTTYRCLGTGNIYRSSTQCTNSCFAYCNMLSGSKYLFNQKTIYCSAGQACNGTLAGFYLYGSSSLPAGQINMSGIYLCPGACYSHADFSDIYTGSPLENTCFQDYYFNYCNGSNCSTNGSSWLATSTTSFDFIASGNTLTIRQNTNVGCSSASSFSVRDINFLNNAHVPITETPIICNGYAYTPVINEMAIYTTATYLTFEFYLRGGTCNVTRSAIIGYQYNVPACPLPGNTTSCVGVPYTCGSDQSCTLTCPSGYTASGGICVASASCLSGTLNTVTDRCESTPAYNCPSGSTYDSAARKCVANLVCPSGYTQSGNVCVANPVCSTGSFNSGTDKCEVVPTTSCPSGYSYNSTTGKCEITPSYSCPSGYTLSGSTCQVNPTCPSGYNFNGTTDKCEYSPPTCSNGSYNNQRDRCETLYSNSCPSLTTYNSVTGYCEATPGCPAGGNLNTSTNKCEATVSSYSCPSGLTYNSSTNKCDATPICQQGGSFDSSVDLCIANVITGCDVGTLSGNICYINAICPQSSTLNISRDICETGNINPSCPVGYTYNSSSGRCEIIQFCNPGVYDSATQKCKVTIPPPCPSGYNPDFSAMKCVYTPPTCPSGATYSTTAKVCTTNADFGCPAQTSYSFGTGLCESVPNCNEGTYDPTLDQCNMGNTTCPLGNYACVENNGSMQCSSISCSTPPTGNTGTDPKNPVCDKRCYDARTDNPPMGYWHNYNANPQVAWNNPNPNPQLVSFDISKGINIGFGAKVKEDGYYISGDKIRVRQSGDTAILEFVHPDGKTYTMSLGVAKNNWVAFSFSINPNFIAGVSRNIDTGNFEQQIFEFPYNPIDFDDPTKSYHIEYTQGLLANGMYDVWLDSSFPSGVTPFCSEQIGFCHYEWTGATGRSYINDPNRVNFSFSWWGKEDIQGNATCSWYDEQTKTYLCNKNRGSLFMNTPTELRDGAEGGWVRIADRSTDNIGIFQSKTENAIKETYAHELDMSSMQWFLRGFLRGSGEIKGEVGNLYISSPPALTTISVSSDRNTTFKNYSFSGNWFWKDVGTPSGLCPSDTLELLDGCWKNVADLCPSGEVNLYPQYNSCYQYIEDASCWNGQTQFGTQCWNKVGTPSECPTDGYSYTLITPPTRDYICHAEKQPQCNYPLTFDSVRGVCYSTVDPSCPFWTTRVDGSCYNSTTLSCPAGYERFYDYCYYYTNQTTCPSGLTYEPTYGVCYYQIYCPSGYAYDQNLDLCLQYYSSACSSGYYWDASLQKCRQDVSSACGGYPWAYDSSAQVCVKEVQASCLSGQAKYIDPNTGYTACYVTDYSHGSPPGHIYCRNNLQFFNDRCYQYTRPICNSTSYDIVLGSSNSYGEWTGQCWDKTYSRCPSGSFIGRGEHTTQLHCLQPQLEVEVIKIPVDQDLLTWAFCEVLHWHNAGPEGYKPCENKTSGWPGCSDSIYVGEGKGPWSCPLNPAVGCVQVTDMFAMCGTDKGCASCYPNNIAGNTYKYVGITQNKEIPGTGKISGMFDQPYSYPMALERIAAVNGRLPDSSEVAALQSLWNVTDFWVSNQPPDVCNTDMNSGECHDIKKSLIVVWDNSNDAGFYTGCVYASNGDAICTGDAVDCVNGVCPLDSALPCADWNGRKICSGTKCYSAADPAAGETEIVTVDDSMYQNDGERDDQGNCRGQVYIFTGRGMRCRGSGYSTGFHNCCNNSQGPIMDSTGSFSEWQVYMGAIKALNTAYDILKTAYYAAQVGGDSLGVWTVNYIYESGVLTKVELVKGVGSLTLDTVELTGTSAQAFSNSGVHSGMLGGGPAGADAAAKAAMDSYIDIVGPQLAAAAMSAVLSSVIDDPVLSQAAQLVVNYIMGTLTTVTIVFAVISLIMNLFSEKCDKLDVETATLNESGYCHYVGDYCEKKWAIVGCVQGAKGFCCFNSKLGRIIHEQGRPQLKDFQPDGAWGEGKKPNCRGFRPEEFQALDFSKMDLSEYYEDIQRDMDQKLQQMRDNALQRIQDFHQSVTQ